MRPSNVAMLSSCVVHVPPAPSMVKASLLASPVDWKLCRWTVPKKVRQVLGAVAVALAFVAQRKFGDRRAEAVGTI